MNAHEGFHAGLTGKTVILVIQKLSIRKVCGLLIDWLIHLLVGWLVGRSVGQPGGWSVSQLVGREFQIWHLKGLTFRAAMLWQLHQQWDVARNSSWPDDICHQNTLNKSQLWAYTHTSHTIIIIEAQVPAKWRLPTFCVQSTQPFACARQLHFTARIYRYASRILFSKGLQGMNCAANFIDIYVFPSISQHQGGAECKNDELEFSDKY